MSKREDAGVFRKVNGVVGLYEKVLNNGEKRYRVKVTVNGHDYYENLDVKPNITKWQLFAMSEDARARLNKKAEAGVLKDYLEDFLSLRGLSEGTKRQYRNYLEDFSMDNQLNGKLTSLIVSRADITDNTKQLMLSKIHKFFEWLHAKLDYVTDPTVDIFIRASDSRRERIATDDEIKFLLQKTDSFGNPYDSLFVRLLLVTGARASTVGGLTPSCLQDGMLTMYNQKMSKRYDVKIPLTDVETLRLWNECTKDLKPDENIFHEYDDIYTAGSRTKEHNKLKHRMNDWFKPDANGERLSPHSLRHTFATNALRAGVPIDVVSKILDHSSIAITLKVYAKHSDEQILAGVQAALSHIKT